MKTTRTFRAALPAITLALMGIVASGTHGAPLSKNGIVVELGGIYPMGGRQGTTVPVRLYGEYLKGAHHLLVAGEGITVRNVRNAGELEAVAELEIAPDALPGPRRVRVVGAHGVSDPVWFVVGQLPEAVEREPNNSSGEAEPIPTPVVMNGRLGGEADVDRFRFAARSGQRLVLAVQAFQLGAQLGTRPRAYVDATLTLYGPDGRVVGRSEDHNTLDPYLVYRTEQEGEYTVEVAEATYGGGEHATYRLTLGEVPWATSIYPAGGQRGSTVDVQVEGDNLPEQGKGRIDLTAAAEGVCYLPPLPGLGNFRQFVVGDVPEALEVEPNGQAAQSPVLAAPVVLNGRIDAAGDADAFRVSLKKGEGVIVDVLASRVLRSPVDLTLAVLDEQGHPLQLNDESPLIDARETDPRLEFLAPADGTYTFVLRDVAGRGGPDCVYRATVTRYTPGFSVETWYDNPSLRGAGATNLVVLRAKRWAGFDGAIRVRLHGLPVGWTGSETVIPAGAPCAVATLTAPADAALGSVVSFTMDAEAVIEGETRRVAVQPTCQLDTNGGEVFQETDGFRAGVVAPDSFGLRAETRRISGKAGERTSVPVLIERRGESPVTLLAFRGQDGAPIQSFGPRVQVPPGVTRFEMPVVLPEGLAPGEYPFVVCMALKRDLRAERPHLSTEVLIVTVEGGGRSLPAGPKAKKKKP